MELGLYGIVAVAVIVAVAAFSKRLASRRPSSSWSSAWR